MGGEEKKKLLWVVGVLSKALPQQPEALQRATES